MIVTTERPSEWGDVVVVLGEKSLSLSAGTLLVIEAARAAGLPEPRFEEEHGAGVRVHLAMAGRALARFARYRTNTP